VTLRLEAIMLRSSAKVLAVALAAITFAARADAPKPSAAGAAVITRHCGSCHTRSSAEAKPAALAVFDLEDPIWLSKLTPDQRESAKRRLPSFKVPPEDQKAARALLDSR
jgi:mono/diheme cytochrome c family protein